MVRLSQTRLIPRSPDGDKKFDVMVQERQVPQMVINEFYNSKILRTLQKIKVICAIIVLIVFGMEMLPDIVCVSFW